MRHFRALADGKDKTLPPQMQVEEPRDLVVVLLDLRCGDITHVLYVRLTFPHLQHRLNASRAELAVHTHGV